MGNTQRRRAAEGINADDWNNTPRERCPRVLVGGKLAKMLRWGRQRDLIWRITSSFPRMHWVVFLRAVNVGGTNRCRPAEIAKQLANFGVVNIGAVGTFVVRKDVSESVLRAALASKMPFKCEIMICPAHDLIRLTAKDPFAEQPSGSDLTRFVSVLHQPLRTPPPLPLCLPLAEDWLLKVFAIENRFVLGIYRREMKAISYLVKMEKLLGVPGTVRNWNTIEKVAKLLREANFP